MTTTGAQIQELPLEPHDYERGVDTIHAVRIGYLTVVVISGPYGINAIGYKTGRDPERTLEEAQGEARLRHYTALAKIKAVPRLGPIRQPAQA